MSNTAAPAMPFAIIVMGVSGSGKTTVGRALAARLGYEFRDGDGFHPPANVEKMRRGVPLDDDDRAPWLAAIAAWVDDLRASGRRGVVACSALKRRYRDVLIGTRGGVALVFLEGDEATIAARMKARRDHFMPPSLLRSQFAALEPPGVEERPIAVPITREPAAIVAAIVEALAVRGRARG